MTVPIRCNRVGASFIGDFANDIRVSLACQHGSAARSDRKVS